jgi:hypothetical protein
LIRKGFILLLLLGGCTGQAMSDAPADTVAPSSNVQAPSPYGDPNADPDMAPDVPDPESEMPDLPESVAI